MKTKKMKAQNLFQRIYILGLVLFALSCGTDEDSIPNARPVMLNQQFEVSESVGGFETIATLEATDEDGDPLTFNLESNIDLTINSSTGTVRTNENSIIDYETATSISFDVSVRDNKGGMTTATITINVLDVDDGSLTNLQKSFVDEYIYRTFNLSPTSISHNSNRKWQGEIKLYMTGEMPSNYQQEVEGYLEEFNAFLSDGTSLVLANSIQESNVRLIMGSTSSVQNVWPDMYTLINGNGFSGYAIYSTSANYIDNGRIWVESGNEDIFKHELGHILGLGHTSDQYCQEGDTKSFMCSNPFASTFNIFDIEIIKALYHPNIVVGLSQEEMRVMITDNILDGTISI